MTNHAGKEEGKDEELKRKRMNEEEEKEVEEEGKDDKDLQKCATQWIKIE